MTAAKKRVLLWMMMGMSWLGMISLFGCDGKNRHLMDGPGMVREEHWTHLDFSQTSDVYEDNFSYTVILDETSHRYALHYAYFDYTNQTPEERTVTLSDDTQTALLAMDLLGLPDAIPATNAQEDEPLMLDGSTVSLTLTSNLGGVYYKAPSPQQVQQLRELLEPYVKTN